MPVKFLKSIYKTEDLPKNFEKLKEVVFVGRSNVGKSSLLNYLTGQNIAKVGKTPGRTRSINYFEWKFKNFKTYLVDLPGYGFAVGNKKELQRWKDLIEDYFRSKKKDIALVLVLIDAKVGPTESDFQMVRWLDYLGLPYAVVLTKVDKAKQSEISKTLKKLKEFGIETVIQTSAKERRGKDKLLSLIASALKDENVD